MHAQHVASCTPLWVQIMGQDAATEQRQQVVFCTLCCGCTIYRAGRSSKTLHLQGATILHKIEQAKYWGSLKRTHDDPSLPKRGKHAVQEQMAACLKSMQAPPSQELVSVVQAACEEEVKTQYRTYVCDTVKCERIVSFQMFDCLLLKFSCRPNRGRRRTHVKLQ